MFDSTILYIEQTLKTLNNNSGVIAAVSPLIAYYLGLKTIKKIDKKKKKEFKQEIENLMLHELLYNINFASQIDNSYSKNLNELNLYIPTTSPRIEIIEKYVEYDIIASLDKANRMKLLNIYTLLKQLKYEYYLWRDLIIKSPDIRKDEVLFTQISLPMTWLLPNVLYSTLDFWVYLVLEIGDKSEHSVIRELNKVMKEKRKKGFWMRSLFKASDYYDDSIKDKYDIVICWENDLVEEIDKEVIEIKEFYNIKFNNGQ